MAYDPVYLAENNKGLAPIARRHYNERTLKELIDPKMMNEDAKQRFTLNRGPNQDSFDAFTKIAYQCLAETQAKRPTIDVIIKELHNARNFQGETTVLSRFQLRDVDRATKSFSETHCIDVDTYGTLYKAELDQIERKKSSSVEETNDGDQPRNHITVAIKRISVREDGQEVQSFYAEIEMRTSYKHPNLVSLLGFCDEGPHMIIVYEHTSNGSLDDYFRSNDNKTKLTWVQRLHMCLEIARGLNHLHAKMGRQQRIIHGDIRSANIMFGKNLEAKIAYFGISKLNPDNKEVSTPATNDNIDTKVYWDPEYVKTGKLEIESDIYSFGVVLFEIFSGRLAYDPIYSETDKGLAPMVRRCFSDGTISKMIDPKLLEETDKDVFTSSKGPKQDSLETFLKIAHQCLGETRAKRPRMETVIEELEKALNFQENLMSNLHISLKDIKLATQSFSPENIVGSGREWKAYRGELPHAKANERTAIVAKQWNRKTGQEDHQFRTELDILYKYKHANIIGLAGYCNEMNEMVIVYKHAASNRSLDHYLNDTTLTWIKRLQICINIASGLEFLHGGGVTLKKLVHGNIKSASILLTADWKAKISDFEYSSLYPLHEHMEHFSGTVGYLDPEYTKSGYLTTKSDIYSFGVVLMEILCGRLAWREGFDRDGSKSLGPLAKCSYEEKRLNEMVFKGIKKQIVPESFTTFANIAYRCISDDVYDRPEASEVVIQLNEALVFQEDEEIWEPKLPRNYKEIIDMSKNPGIYSEKKKKDLYKMLSEGIYLPKGKVWFSLSQSGKANAMISATMFSYKNHRSHKARSIHGTRFHTVAKMMDISDLNIQIKIKTEVLSPNTNYGVHFIFKSCDPKVSNKPIFVNLKYRMGNELLHAYFAKQRDDDGWMMIELCRFLNNKDDTSLEVSIESFSRYYCGSSAIFVQGIQFQAIENMKNEERNRLKGAQQIPVSSLNTDQMQQSSTDLGEAMMGFKNNYDGEKLFLLREVNGKQHLILSAEKVLYNSDKLELFHLKPSTESRFQNVMELLPQQVIRIKYKIESEKLSPFTEYACYLVFKLSNECCGLHCPVKVRDLLHRKSKETKIVYFRSPTPINQHDGNSVPFQRKDGWMEVMVWKFNSKYKLGNNLVPMNLKFIAYEGTMSGLTICSLEFRPM